MPYSREFQRERRRIRRLGIRTRARISALSGGERAQVALTLVLAKRPELFLLDEPSASLGDRRTAGGAG